MNAIARPDGRSPPGIPLIGPVLSAWRSISRRELRLALAFGLGAALVRGLSSIEAFSWDKPLGAPQILSLFVVMPVATALIALLTWVVADRTTAEGLKRWLRLGAALVVAAVVSSWMLQPALFDATGVTELWLLKVADLHTKGEQLLSRHYLELQAMLSALVFGGLAFTLIEVRRRQRETNAALAMLLSKRALLARRVFESRLAAMQAQVEPQFLFNTLVDIEALYERDPRSASRILDDLITYLRVALPRLRETGAASGSLLSEEMGLVRAYLEVVAARHGGRPHTRFVIEPDCAGARFYPMLLLPLVQRGVRGTEQGEPPPADRVEITAKRVHDDIFIALRVHAAGLCDDHPELQRVRERLEGLYGGRATLYCGEPKPGVTDFTLKIPFESQ